MISSPKLPHHLILETLLMLRIVATLSLSVALAACAPEAVSPQEKNSEKAGQTKSERTVGNAVHEPQDKTITPKEAIVTTTALPLASTQGGLIVVVDPVTRQIREATPAEIAEMNSGSPARALSVPVFVQGPDGAIGTTLGPESQVFTVATREPDGKLTVGEVVGEKAAKKTVDSKDRPEHSNDK
jgi:hypothetical protein